MNSLSGGQAPDSPVPVATPRAARPIAPAHRRTRRLPAAGGHRSSRPVSRREASSVLARLAALTAAGLSTGEALASCARSGHGLALRLHAAVQRGSALSAALAERSLPLSEAEVALVRAGERGGSTARALALLSERMEGEATGRSRIASALAYPCLLILGATGALCFLSIIVLPSFTSLYEGSQVKLPLSTRALLMFGESAQAWGPTGGPLLLALVLLVPALRRASDPFAGLCDRIALQWWPLRTVARPRAVQESCALLAMLLEAGTEVEEALGLASRAAPNRVIAARQRQALRALRHGVPLSRAWNSAGLDPHGDALALLEIAEATGSYAAAFSRIAALEGAAAEQALTRLCRLAEPLAVLAMAVAVGGGVLALYQPMLGSASLLLGGNP